MRHLGRALITVAGLATAAYLVLEQGFDEVFRALHVAGLSGVASITLLHILLPTALCGLAWWLLLGRGQPVGITDYIWIRWIRDGMDGVVPFLPVSGELIAIRILGKRGVRLADASTIVDLTAELLAEVAFAALGFAFALVTHPGSRYLPWLAAGIGLMALQFSGFLIAQVKGLFRLIEHPVRWLRSWRSDADEAPSDGPLHERLLSLYADREAFFSCWLVHLIAWLTGGLEAWLGLWFMGHPLPLVHVLAIEGLVVGARSLAFFVPLGAGVQEGAYVVIGGLLGLPPNLALAVSLLKRGRDLVIGIPALLCWQLIEARELGRLRSRGDVIN